ncbi:hypothetical protein EEW87_17645 (plasmid) [Janibacter melonis]|uniref:Secreted protein n=1 Tax=Janibacter melonis TaxID=262209 RepID=A0A650GFK5_9MICO|nr:hypothetical protein [Janibacter melonis]QGX08829.1 hypothetical protein EEW87_17645 [Janibacter melonis]
MNMPAQNRPISPARHGVRRLLYAAAAGALLVTIPGVSQAGASPHAATASALCANQGSDFGCYDPYRKELWVVDKECDGRAVYMEFRYFNNSGGVRKFYAAGGCNSSPTYRNADYDVASIKVCEDDGNPVWPDPCTYRGF